MMDQLPYGSNIIINSTSSNISDKFSINRPDFITSKKQATTITYHYTEKNGTLVSISTNLTCTLDTVNKTFTLSNDNIFNKGTKPYIELHCDDVKIYMAFTDHDGTGNKWSSLTENTDDLTIKGHNEDNYVKVAKYCVVSWSKVNNNQNLFIEKEIGEDAYSEYYACDAFYLYKDNNNIKKGTSTIYSSQVISLNKITTPKLDGSSSALKFGTKTIETKNFYKYFALGTQIKILDGCSVYQSTTQPYVKGTNKIYNNIGFFNTISGTTVLNDDNGVPKILSNSELQYKWNSDFFYITNNNEYISPSTSEVYYKWDITSECQCQCQCDCNCQCQCNTICDCQELWEDDNGNSWYCDKNSCNYCDYCDCECYGGCQCQCQTGTCEGCQCNNQCNVCDASCQCECQSGTSHGFRVNKSGYQTEWGGYGVSGWTITTQETVWVPYGDYVNAVDLKNGSVLLYGNVATYTKYGEWF